ncbi:VOC family protein [Aestuariirhabdus sp. LZHN29]|uniref:VOC family protein n=1 Tax=Aestuariirhabdus sp. LZHN29 TaxID=3417462 RepID=UPI003CE6A952
MYHLNAVRVFTRDFDNALAFYEETLGLDVSSCDEEAGFALFDTGPAKLILEQLDEDSELVGRFSGVSLAVDDIHAEYDELDHLGVQFTGPPEQQSWGGWLVHLLDYDNNIITLVGEG